VRKTDEEKEKQNKLFEENNGFLKKAWEEWEALGQFLPPSNRSSRVKAIAPASEEATLQLWKDREKSSGTARPRLKPVRRDPNDLVPEF